MAISVKTALQPPSCSAPCRPGTESASTVRYLSWAAEHLAKVRASDPGVADRYALMLGVGQGAPRAADPAEQPPALLWGSSE